MNNIGLKALATILMVGRRSGKHVNWTLTIAVICTLATVLLVAAYLVDQFGGK